MLNATTKSMPFLKENYNDPLQNFLYALKAPDSKRHYPRRLEYFFDYLGLDGTLKEKCLIFYNQAKTDLQWTQHQLMQYIEFQKERAEKGEIAESTISQCIKCNIAYTSPTASGEPQRIIVPL